MSEESVKTSNELIGWLKMLALPAWARLTLAPIMLLILVSALGLFAQDFAFFIQGLLNVEPPHG